jgi:riboflavin kinase / FMN adenylyltransferase
VTIVIKTDDFRSLNKKDITKKSVITIGNFDGCHLGHQQLTKETIKLARSLGCCSLVFTFDPHPVSVMKPSSSIELLGSLSQKISILSELGVDYIVVQKFSNLIKSLQPEEFYQSLVSSLSMNALVIGSDFSFGANRQGNCSWLLEKGLKDKVQVKILKDQTYNNELVKSSQIRSLLKNKGDASLVADLLGYPYCLSGKAVSGKGLGKTLGFATINLEGAKTIFPKNGVYAGYIWLSKSKEFPENFLKFSEDRYSAVFNLGVRPTVSKENSFSIEGHILDYPEKLPARVDGFFVCFFLTHRIRDEIKFANSMELKAQIDKDCQQVKNIIK